MEDILFDYQLADGIMRIHNVDSATQQSYTDAVLEKHGVSRDVFDSSMVYYATHADLLHEIYEHLSDRLTNEGRLQGVESNNLFTYYSIEGDTTNIWNLDDNYLFTTYVPDNMVKFHITADTTFYPGDRFILSFRSSFLLQDGTRNGYVMFSVRFANDSVVTRTKQLMQVATNSLDISDDKRLGIKELRGFFLNRLPNVTKEGGVAALRLMYLSDIQLIKMHTEEPVKEEQEPAAEEMAADSIIAEKDTIANKQNDNTINTERDEKNKTVPATVDVKRSH